MRFVDELKTMPIAIATETANEQHYEVSDLTGTSVWKGKTMMHHQHHVPFLVLNTKCARCGIPACPGMIQ
jgi:hypothetical protein